MLAATALVAAGLPLSVSPGLFAGLPAGAATAASGTASAAVCTQQSVPAYTRNARAVFTGAVTSSDGEPRTDGIRGQVFTQAVTVERVYKGSVASDEVTVQTDKAAKQCTMGRLVTGATYVFFASGDGDPWVVAGGSGTAVSSPELVVEVEGLLGSGRSPVAPEKESATFSEVDVSDPTAISRLAAPGAALVIIGLLGLLVVGRLGRRSS